jgi:hypothetical protein
VPAHNKLVEKHAVPFSDLFFEMIPRDFYDCFSICQSTISVLRSNRKASGDYWFTSFFEQLANRSSRTSHLDDADHNNKIHNTEKSLQKA